jgi:integrase
MLAHLKTFAKWVHTHQPFPLGNPMAALKLPTIGTGLEVERALTPAERRRLLDAADLLLTVGGRSKDRKRYKRGERPQRKGYRPYRNRAIVYALIETGMRRAAITQLNLDQGDLRRKTLTVVEKGGYTHTYQISREGAQVQGRTPHSARHAMGKHIMAKTGNIAAVQKQLGHRQAAYAMQYARVTAAELAQVLDER